MTGPLKRQMGGAVETVTNTKRLKVEVEVPKGFDLMTFICGPKEGREERLEKSELALKTFERMPESEQARWVDTPLGSAAPYILGQAAKVDRQRRPRSISSRLPRTRRPRARRPHLSPRKANAPPAGSSDDSDGGEGDPPGGLRDRVEAPPHTSSLIGGAT